MEYIKLKSINIPDEPGVYKFYDHKERLIYIGKASVLKNRIKSYFIGAHDSKTEKLVSEIFDIKWIATSSVIEAIILESNLIKKYKPKYNILSKDDKSFIEIVLTNEEYPILIPLRPTDKIKQTLKIKKIFGPYTNSNSIKEILSIFRKIFTFRDCSKIKFDRHKKKNSPCLFYSIKLCPAPCTGQISKTEYMEIIKQMSLFFEGKRKSIVSLLKKQMQNYSKVKKYEKASIIRDRINAFEHINDIAVIKRERSLEQYKNIPSRIEAYDISNIGNKFAVGSMVVLSHGEVDKNEYRKFKIKFTSGQNDSEMIAEILERRFNHPEWQKPDLILIDGGKGQLNAALKALKNHKMKIPTMSIAKGPNRKGYKLFKNTLANKITIDKNFIESIRNEAHRFAITYHRKLRSNIIPKNNSK